MSATRSPAPGNSAALIAGLTLVNAMVFQEVLADYQTQVLRLRQVLQSPDPISAFAEHWQFILTNINYHPIFNVAHQLLLTLPSNPDSEKAVRALAHTALEVVRERAALRHDLMGRIYHRLLTQAKYLGTYYTSVPAATLLLKVALEPGRWSLDWSHLGQLSLFTVGDLACGTGTLLMAAAEAITDNYLRACGEQHQRPYLDRLSRLLMEDVIWGYDVLASALHLTASTLALRSPEVSFKMMRLWTLPLGGRHHRLGSIEFLKDVRVPITVDLFGEASAPGQVTSRGERKGHYASLPDLDLCVMNPPFTRSVGGNLLFGSLPDAERRPMQQELARLLHNPSIHASSTAGLGSVFAAVGNLHLKDGGRIALVLPKALLSGVAWGQTRLLFHHRYQLEYLMVSHDPARWNFSENTDLSEALVVARKLKREESAGAGTGNVVCLNLWKNPTTAVEALGIAHALVNGEAPDIESGQGALEIRLGDSKVAEAVSIPWAGIREGLWMPPCAFAQSELLRAAHHLLKGRLYLPGTGIAAALPLCPLGDLGTLGPDRRDIHDGFRLSKGKTAYPAFWGHDASVMTTMAQRPNASLSPLPRAKAGRPLRRATDLWPRAGRVLLAERLRLNTQRLSAVRTDSRVLSNVWWPLTFLAEGEAAEKALVLWLNSTLGLLTLLAHREETQGAWIDFKKPVLAEMPVLNVGGLSPEQRERLAETYDRLSGSPLLPFPEMRQDLVRRAIDEAICRVLGLPEVGVLRELLSREPVVCLEPLG